MRAVRAWSVSSIFESKRELRCEQETSGREGQWGREGGVVDGLGALRCSPVGHNCSDLIRIIHFIIRVVVLALSNMQHADGTEEVERHEWNESDERREWWTKITVTFELSWEGKPRSLNVQSERRENVHLYWTKCKANMTWTAERRLDWK